MNFIDDCVLYAVKEFKKGKNKDKFYKEVISPILYYILNEIRPYIIGLSIFLVLIILIFSLMTILLYYFLCYKF